MSPGRAFQETHPGRSCGHRGEPGGRQEHRDASSGWRPLPDPRGRPKKSRSEASRPIPGQRATRRRVVIDDVIRPGRDGQRVGGGDGRVVDVDPRPDALAVADDRGTRPCEPDWPTLLFGDTMCPARRRSRTAGRPPRCLLLPEPATPARRRCGHGPRCGGWRRPPSPRIHRRARGRAGGRSRSTAGCTTAPPAGQQGAVEVVAALQASASGRLGRRRTSGTDPRAAPSARR